MAVRLQRPRKLETIIKQRMEEAVRRLNVSDIQTYECCVWAQTLPDEQLLVELWGGSAFSNGTAVLHSTRYGQWTANLNGTTQTRIGKPTQRHTAAEITTWAETHGAMPRCHPDRTTTYVHST